MLALLHALTATPPATPDPTPGRRGSDGSLFEEALALADLHVTSFRFAPGVIGRCEANADGASCTLRSDRCSTFRRSPHRIGR